MNPYLLKAMRRAVERMLTIVQRWEDRHEGHNDCRVDHLHTGLWQASDSITKMLNGESDFGYRRPVPSKDEWGKTSPEGNRYAAEMLGDTPVPLFPAR